jgi:hypothetical protein
MAWDALFDWYNYSYEHTSEPLYIVLVYNQLMTSSTYKHFFSVQPFLLHDKIILGTKQMLSCCHCQSVIKSLSWRLLYKYVRGSDY